MAETDEYILITFRQGELEGLYRYLYPALLWYAVKYMGNEMEFLAEDCVQNAIFNAWKRKERFDSVYTLKSFLYTSIKNEIISLRRKQKARVRYSSQLEQEWVFNNSVIEVETQALLYHAIQALPSKERRIFELSFLEGLKNNEIAEKLGLSDSTVKKNKARALDMLRRKLGPVIFFLLFFSKE